MKLSIIIPCYNCASTLNEAVASCYTQGLDNSEFEIIMVDDGSTDTTRTEMETLAKKHTNMRLLFHEKNRGGGAARNTGIEAATGDILYCLDSDNFFTPNSVPQILLFLQNHNLDGVVFHERRFFAGKNVRKYSTHINKKLDADIEIADIFSIKSHILLDNFFFTKKAYLKTRGYPEHHGFDTQCYEVRFLSVGNRVRVCPASTFYHRQDTRNNSYFQRVYKQGHFSLNYFLIMEDIIHLLNDKTIEILMNFDLFGAAKLNHLNLKAQLDSHLEKLPGEFLRDNYLQFLSQSGRDEWYHQFQSNVSPTVLFARATIAYGNQQYNEAIESNLTILKSQKHYQNIYFNLLRAEIGLTKLFAPRDQEKEALRIISSMSPKQQFLGTKAKILKVIMDTLR